MCTVTLPTDSLRALINVYKASLEIHTALRAKSLIEVFKASVQMQKNFKLSALDQSDEEVSDESLDWPDFSMSYFDLSQAIDQAKSKVTGLEAILNTAPSSLNLKLNVQIEGQETEDLQNALNEVLRLVEDDFTSGFDRNETGSYRFAVE
jgi:hypothetical protein